MFNTLERAPTKGESVAVPGYVIRCIDVSGSRIARVHVREQPESESETGNGRSRDSRDRSD
jgi:CBS domain containing-hemolysin-like protein